MKYLGWLWLLPLVALASNHEDYVRQWPLQLEPADAGAYQVTLTEPVYRTAIQPDLADVQPLDAAGMPLPSALLAADASPPPRLQPLPMFVLPPVEAADGGNGEVQLIAERDAKGAVRRIETRTGPTPGRHGLPVWLLDASAIHAPLRAIRLDWPAQQHLQAELRIEGSDDLQHWWLLDPHAALVELDNGREHLQQRRVPLDTRARYLRITALSAQVPVLSAVQAEVVPLGVAVPLHWLTLSGRAHEGGFEFELDGRFPITQVDVVGKGDDARQWRLFSRDSDQAHWVACAGPWLAYRLGAAVTARSAPQAVVSRRDRYWRLVPSAGAPVSVPPQLRLGWRPETLVFLTQGEAPYGLAAGSARARRVDAPLRPMLDALRRERAAQWQPAEARLGMPARELAGAAALRPERDWKTWLLWGLLGLGAFLISGFALNLLRARSR